MQRDFRPHRNSPQPSAVSGVSLTNPIVSLRGKFPRQAAGRKRDGRIVRMRWIHCIRTMFSADHLPGPPLHG